MSFFLVFELFIFTLIDFCFLVSCFSFFCHHIAGIYFILFFLSLFNPLICFYHIFRFQSVSPSVVPSFSFNRRFPPFIYCFVSLHSCNSPLGFVVLFFSDICSLPCCSILFLFSFMEFLSLFLLSHFFSILIKFITCIFLPYCAYSFVLYTDFSCLLSSIPPFIIIFYILSFRFIWLCSPSPLFFMFPLFLSLSLLTSASFPLSVHFFHFLVWLYRSVSRRASLCLFLLCVIASAALLSCHQNVSLAPLYCPEVWLRFLPAKSRSLLHLFPFCLPRL